MLAPQRENTVVDRTGPSGLLRFGLCALVTIQKALLCLVLLEAAFEIGFLPEAAAKEILELVEEANPTDRPDDHHHAPNALPVTHRQRPVCVPAEVADHDPAARPPGPRAPPLG